MPDSYRPLHEDERRSMAVDLGIMRARLEQTAMNVDEIRRVLLIGDDKTPSLREQIRGHAARLDEIEDSAKTTGEHRVAYGAAILGGLAGSISAVVHWFEKHG